MHGLINRTIQCFVRDTYGRDTWLAVAQRADLGHTEFEAMLIYPDEVTPHLLASAGQHLGKDVETLLEDIGTYLVSNPNVEALRRLLRFGGVTFVEFLHSLDDLPDRARLAVSDLDLPVLELDEHSAGHFNLRCLSRHAGFGHMLMGVLRAMADDYGALVFLEHKGGRPGEEIIDITLVETAYAEGRSFDLGGSAVGERAPAGHSDANAAQGAAPGHQKAS